MIGGGGGGRGGGGQVVHRRRFSPFIRMELKWKAVRVDLDIHVMQVGTGTQGEKERKRTHPLINYNKGNKDRERREVPFPLVYLVRTKIPNITLHSQISS